MKTVKLFLASSEELKRDRIYFGDYLRQKSEEMEPRDFKLKLFEWEDYDAAFNQKRKQSEYNEFIVSCDIFVALFNNKAGMYTAEEVDCALQNNKTVYVLLKGGKATKEHIIQLLKQKDSIANIIWCEFKETEDLRQWLNHEIDTYIDKHTIDIDPYYHHPDNEINVYHSASTEASFYAAAIGNLVRVLNDSFQTKGYHIRLMPWNESLVKNNKEMFLALLNTTPENKTVKEFKSASKRFSKDQTSKTFVYIKTKDGEDGEDMMAFKKELTDVLQRFWNEYQGEEDVKNNFVMQLFKIHGGLLRQEVKNQKIMIEDHMIIDMKELSFVKLNKEYQEKQERLNAMHEELDAIRERMKTDGSDAEDLYFEKKREYTKSQNELDDYETNLLATANFIANLSADKYSERILKAQEAFNKGNADEADKILDLDEMLTEKKRNEMLFEIHRNNMKLIVEEYAGKMNFTINNPNISKEERMKRANLAFKEAAKCASEIGLELEKQKAIYKQYAELLEQCGNKAKADKIREKMPTSIYH